MILSLLSKKYDFHQRKRKFYTYSNLFGDFASVEDELIVRSEEISFYFSTSNETLFNVFHNLLKNVRYHNLEGIKLEYCGYKDCTYYIDGEICVFKTMAPLLIRHTVYGKQWDYSLFDEISKTILEENTRHKYLEFSGINDDTFKVDEISYFKPKTVTIKDTACHGNLAVIKVSGSREILNFVYQAGLGSKNSMGFGMMHVIGDECDFRIY